MGLFRKKKIIVEEKIIDEQIAPDNECYEITEEEYDHVMSILKQIREQIKENYLEDAKKLSRKKLDDLIDELEEEIYESGTDEFNLHWKSNVYTHTYLDDNGNLRTNKPGQDLNCGQLSCFSDYIVEVALKDLDDLRGNKRGLDFSKIK